MSESHSSITMYTSNFCGHSWAVEKFMQENDVSVELINIDGDPEARQVVMGLNNGNASVPTLIFADGTQMTEPSFGQLREKLGMKRPSLFNTIRNLFSRED